MVKAWMDPEFEERLLRDPASAAAELGINTSNPNSPTILTVLKSTPTKHNLVVCTLCSCYPRAVLGYPPFWFKSAAYRARAVRDPRGLLKEFGTTLPESVRLRVVDSTADYRWMVLPLRPAGTEGWSEERLAELVTRDSMIGTGLPKVPQ